MKLRILHGKIALIPKNVVSMPGTGNFKTLKTGIPLLFLMCIFIPPFAGATSGYNSPQEDIMLSEALHRLSQKYEVFFSYDQESIEHVEVTYQPEKYKNVKHALDQLLAGTSLKYKIFDNRYIILYEESKQALSSLKGMVRHLETVIDDQERAAPVRKERPVALLDHSIIKEIKSLAISVSGTVTDQGGEPLIGVNIQVKGTNKGTATDFEGRFTLEDIDENAVLVVSYVGYQTQEVPVAGKSNLTIVMVSDSQLLDEVVVVGYGTQKKSDLTGSVISLKAEDINQGVNTSIDQMLKGRATGVSVVQNSSEPGGGVSISVRGASSFTAGTEPLYVIDGLPINNSSLTTSSGPNFPNSRTPSNPLSAINPEDIESIEVLKDASATAIYGSRGANGVILVTTKTGRKGKIDVNYDGYFGIQNVIKQLDLLSTNDYMRIINKIISEGGGNPEEEVKGIENGGTNWQDLVFRNNSPVQNHNISLSGGGENTTYYAALNYFNQDGVVISSGFERYGARLNMDTKVSDKIQVGLNLNTNFSFNDQVASQSFGINENNGALYAAYNFDPSLSPFNDDGSYRVSEFHSIDNPLALAYGKTSFIRSFRTLGTANVEYTPLESISFKLNIGTDVTNQRRDNYIDRKTKDGRANGGIGSVFQQNISNYLVELTSSYQKLFADHNFSGLIGITTQQFKGNSTSMTSRNFPADATKTDNLGLGDPTLFSMGSGRSGYQLISYIGRVNYSLKNRYLFTVTMRVDGSSRFGENHKFGYFPSGAFGWKITEEPFMVNFESLNTLKLRGSWGQTGNQAIGNYQSISTFSQGRTAVFNIGGSSTQFSTTDPTRIANPNLKWETTEQWDIGLDFGFVKNRFHGEIDYFHKNTYDMLINLPIPTSSGFTTQLTNVGRVINHGFELTFSSVNIDKGNLYWNLSLSLATINNEVKDLGGIDRIISGNTGSQNTNFFLTEAGLPMRSFYGYQIDGIWQSTDDFSATTDNVSPGDIKYHDLNNDGAVNAKDRVILGNSFPDLTWSIGNNITYKNFDLSVFFEGVEGVEMLNQNLVDSYFPINLRRNKFAEPYLNRWTESNPSEKYPSFVNAGSQGVKQVNSYTVEDASYLRLKTLSLSYSLPRFTRTISQASVYLTANNLWTLTNYNGIDPAINPNGNAVSRIDFNMYPTAKSVLLGLKIKF